MGTGLHLLLLQVPAHGQGRGLGLLVSRCLGVCFLQAKQLVSRVVTQNICQYRSLQYSRQEGLDGGLPEEVLFGMS